MASIRAPRLIAGPIRRPIRVSGTDAHDLGLGLGEGISSPSPVMMGESKRSSSAINIASPTKLTHSAVQQVFGSRPSVAVDSIKRKRGSLSHRELASVIGSRATGHLRHRRSATTTGSDVSYDGNGGLSHRLIAEVAGSRATARAVRRRSRLSATTPISSSSSTTTTTTTTTTTSSSSSSSGSNGSGDTPAVRLSHAEIAAQHGGNARRAHRRSLLPSHRDIARTFGQRTRVNGGAGAGSDGNASADDGSASDIGENPALVRQRSGPSHAEVAAAFGARHRALANGGDTENGIGTRSAATSPVRGIATTTTTTTTTSEETTVATSSPSTAVPAATVVSDAASSGSDNDDDSNGSGDDDAPKRQRV